MDKSANDAKAASTVIVWISVMIIFVAADPSSLMQFMLLFSAIGATAVIWVATQALMMDDMEKAKRHGGSVTDIDENEIRLRVLMEMLDEEDKARIRAKLMNQFSDGEVPVDELLKDESAQ